MAANPSRALATARAAISPDGLVLLDLHGGMLLASNAVGARIWQLLDEGHHTADIVHRLVAEYGISLDRAQGDVTAFVAALAARGLVAGESA